MSFYGSAYFGSTYWGPGPWGTTPVTITTAAASAQPSTENISEIGICNSALQKIGLRRILSFAEEQATGVSEAQKVAAHQYSKLRDALLQMHHWNFAIKRKQLTQTTTPPFEWDYAYALESDFIRTIAVHQNDAGHGLVVYRQEAGVIVMNSPECWHTYIRKVIDPVQMTADFRELLSIMLAREFAIPLADSLTLHDMMDELFDTEFQRTTAADAIENFPADWPESPWVTARHEDIDDEEVWAW